MIISRINRYGLFFIGLFFCVLLATANAESLANNAPLKPVTVQLTWKHQFQFAGIYAAIKQGYYAERGLAVTAKEWQPGITPLNEVLAGRADFGIEHSSALIDCVKGAPIQLLMAAFQYSPMILLSHEPITHLEQMSGKMVYDLNSLQILSMFKTLENPVVRVPHTGRLNDFIEHKVDFYAAYATNEPYQLQLMHQPYHIVDPRLYGIQSQESLVITSEKNARTNQGMVQAFKEATIAGWQYALEHQEEIVDYIIANYPVDKTREALIYEANATAPLVKSGSIPIGALEATKLVTALTLAKEVDLITQAQLDAFKPESFIFSTKQSWLTEQEWQYLQQHPSLTLANDNRWMPFEFMDKEARYQGIVADYLKLMEKKLGVYFQATQDKSWSEVLQLVRDQQLDVIPSIVITPTRQRDFSFTKPYLSFPITLVANSSQTYVADFNQLNGKTIAVVKDYWVNDYLEQNYPSVNLLLVDNVEVGLSAVSKGEAFAYADNLMVINHHMQQLSIQGLNVIGQTQMMFDLAMAVHKDNSVLLGILEKALSSISEEERQQIYSKWVKLEVINRLDSAQLKQLTLYSLLIVGVFLLVVLFYRQQKNNRQNYINQIHELTLASKIAIADARVVWTSQSYARLTGYSLEELKQLNYRNLSANTVTEAQKDAIFMQVTSGRSWTGEIEAVRKDGSHYWIELTLTPQKDWLGRIQYAWATRVDISDKKRIEQLSIIDELTGLYNRRYYNKIVEQEINRAKREDRCLSAVIIDIDFFKSINDTYGHQRGDEVLVAVAQQIQQHFNRANDFVFRIGGEEFVVLAQFQDEQELVTHLEALRTDVMGLQIENSQAPLEVLTISIGAGLWQSNELPDSDQLYSTIDHRLYQAKEQGRNRIILA